MNRRSLGLALACLMLSACSTQLPGAPAPLKNWVGGDAIKPQLLVSGLLTLPPGLVSAGAGQLVSAGAGQLVSAGAGSLISAGSAQYRIQSLAEVPVSGAAVTLLDPLGTGAALATATTDTSGSYRLMGSPRTGICEMAATVGGRRYLSLAALSGTQAPRADIDVATTLLSTHLLATAGGLHVLAVSEFAAAAASLRQALPGDLPPDWTPAQAAATLAKALQSSNKLSAALGALDAEQKDLQDRMGTLSVATQPLASQLGLSPVELTQRLAVTLSQNPQASDAQIVSAVRAPSSALPALASPLSSVDLAPIASAAALPSPQPLILNPTLVSPTPTATTPAATPSQTPAPASKPKSEHTQTPAQSPIPSVVKSPTPIIATPSPLQTIAATPTPVPSEKPTPRHGGISPFPTPSPRPSDHSRKAPQGKASGWGKLRTDP